MPSIPPASLSLGKPSPISTSVTASDPKPSTPRRPVGSKVIEVVEGVKQGNRGIHNVAVLDMTGDSTQIYPYLNHCDTCAWEGRYNSLGNAKLNARSHAGV